MSRRERALLHVILLAYAIGLFTGAIITGKHVMGTVALVILFAVIADDLYLDLRRKH